MWYLLKYDVGSNVGHPPVLISLVHVVDVRHDVILLIAADLNTVTNSRRGVHLHGISVVVGVVEYNPHFAFTAAASMTL